MSNDKSAATFHPGGKIPTTPGGMTNAASVAPRATRVIDGSTYHVALDLEPVAVSLLPDIARALTQAHVSGSLYLLGSLRPGHPLYAETLGKVTAALRIRGALVVQLHPAAAERLSSDLWDAKDEPDLCRWGEGDCSSYADGDFCLVHQGLAEDISDRIRGA